MALAFNDKCIIYYHMDVKWSTELSETYFANHTCLSDV